MNTGTLVASDGAVSGWGPTSVLVIYLWTIEEGGHQATLQGWSRWTVFFLGRSTRVQTLSLEMKEKKTLSN